MNIHRWLREAGLMLAALIIFIALKGLFLIAIYLIGGFLYA